MAPMKVKYRIVCYFEELYKRYWSGSGWTKYPKSAATFCKEKVERVMSQMDSDGLYPFKEQIGFEHIGRGME